MGRAMVPYYERSHQCKQGGIETEDLSRNRRFEPHLKNADCGKHTSQNEKMTFRRGLWIQRGGTMVLLMIGILLGQWSAPANAQSTAELCSALDVSTCTSNTNCEVATSTTGIQSCQSISSTDGEDPCDVKLNYSIAYPHGCPESCVVRELSSGAQVCEARNFWDELAEVYWGSTGLPIGYLFWNFMLGFSIILTVRIAPAITAWTLCRMINTFVLKPNKSDPFSAALRISSLRIALFGGRVTFEELEYASANIHLRIVEGGVSVRWWLSSDGIMQDPAAFFLSKEDTDQGGSSEGDTDASYSNRWSRSSKTAKAAATHALGQTQSGKKRARSRVVDERPPRLTGYVSGVELSVFNNVEKFNAIETFLTRYMPIPTREPSATDLDAMESGLGNSNQSRLGRTRSKGKPSFCRRVISCCYYCCPCLGSRSRSSSSAQSYATSKLGSPPQGPLSSRDRDGADGSASAQNGAHGGPPAMRLDTNIHMSDDQREGSVYAVDDEASVNSTYTEENPWFYHVFPISRFELSQFCIYVSDPSLRTTLIMHAEKGLGIHYVEEPTFEMDRFKVVSRLVWTNTRLRLVKNEEYVGTQRLMERHPIEDDDLLERGGRAVVNFFRELFSEITMTDYRGSKHRASVLGIGSDEPITPTSDASSPHVPRTPRLAALVGKGPHRHSTDEDEDEDEDEEDESDARSSSRRRRASDVEPSDDDDDLYGDNYPEDERNRSGEMTPHRGPRRNSLDDAFGKIKNLMRNSNNVRRGSLGHASTTLSRYDSSDSNDSGIEVASTHSFGATGSGSAVGGSSRRRSSSARMSGRYPVESPREYDSEDQSAEDEDDEDREMARFVGFGDSKQYHHHNGESSIRSWGISRMFRRRKHGVQNDARMRPRKSFLERNPFFETSARKASRRRKRKSTSADSSGLKTGAQEEPDLLVTNRLEFVYKFDEPGPVTHEQIESFDGKQQPEFSLNIYLGSSSEDSQTIITYGPWADKERSQFLQRFWPVEFQETPIYHPYRAGEPRVPLFLEANVFFKGRSSIRMPYRVRHTGWYDGTKNGENASNVNVWSTIQQHLDAFARASEMKTEQKHRQTSFAAFSGGGGRLDSLTSATMGNMYYEPNENSDRLGSMQTLDEGGSLRGGIQNGISSTATSASAAAMASYNSRGPRNLSQSSISTHGSFPNRPLRVGRSLATGWIVHLPVSTRSMLAKSTEAQSALATIAEYQSHLLRATVYISAPENEDKVVVKAGTQRDAEEWARELWVRYAGRERKVSAHLRTLCPSCPATDDIDEVVRYLPIAHEFENRFVAFLFGMKKANSADESRQRVSQSVGAEEDLIHELSEQYGYDHPQIQEMKRVMHDNLARFPAEFEANLKSFLLPQSSATMTDGDFEEDTMDEPPVVLQREGMDSQWPSLENGGPGRARPSDSSGQESSNIDETDTGYSGPLSYAKAHSAACGWLDLDIGDDSRMTVSIPLVSTSESGYETIIELTMKKPVLRSSVTQSEMLRSMEYKMRTSILYSNQWNGRQMWSINQTMKRSEVRFVRENVNCIMDFVTDWTSKPQSEEAQKLEFFTPITYSIQADMDRVNWILNVNEKNVVGTLSDDSFNHIVDVDVPKVHFRSEMRTTEFEALREEFTWTLSFENIKAANTWASTCAATLRLPVDHPRRKVVHPRPAMAENKISWRDPRILTFDRLDIEGRYVYHNEVGENTDLLKVNLHFMHPKILALPEAIDAFVNFQANYFGGSMFLITPDDFAACGNRNLRSRVAFQNWTLADNIILRSPSNEFELRFGLHVTDGSVQLPICLQPCLNAQGDIQDADHSTVTLLTNKFVLDMRYNYDRYMDLDIRINHVRLQCPSSHALGTAQMPSESNQGLSTSVNAAAAAAAAAAVAAASDSPILDMRGLHGSDSFAWDTSITSAHSSFQTSNDDIAGSNSPQGHATSPVTPVDLGHGEWTRRHFDRSANSMHSTHAFRSSGRSREYDGASQSETTSRKHRRQRLTNKGSSSSYPYPRFLEPRMAASKRRRLKRPVRENGLGNPLQGCLLWDGGAYSIQWLYGRDQGVCMAPLVAYSSSMKADAGKIRGDLQMAQMHAIYEAADSFVKGSSRLRSSDRDEGGVKSPLRAGAMLRNPRMIWTRLVQSKAKYLVRIDLDQASYLPSLAKLSGSSSHRNSSKLSAGIFTQVECNGQIFRTPIIASTSDKVTWGSQCIFFTSSLDVQVRVHLYDESYGRQRLIGKIVLDVARFLENQEPEGENTLRELSLEECTSLLDVQAPLFQESGSKKSKHKSSGAATATTTVTGVTGATASTTNTEVPDASISLFQSLTTSKVDLDASDADPVYAKLRKVAPNPSKKPLAHPLAVAAGHPRFVYGKKRLARVKTAMAVFSVSDQTLQEVLKRDADFPSISALDAYRFASARWKNVRTDYDMEVANDGSLPILQPHEGFYRRSSVTNSQGNGVGNSSNVNVGGGSGSGINSTSYSIYNNTTNGNGANSSFYNGSRASVNSMMGPRNARDIEFGASSQATETNSEPEYAYESSQYGTQFDDAIIGGHNPSRTLDQGIFDSLLDEDRVRLQEKLYSRSTTSVVLGGLDVTLWMPSGKSLFSFGISPFELRGDSLIDEKKAWFIQSLEELSLTLRHLSRADKPSERRSKTSSPKHAYRQNPSYARYVESSMYFNPYASGSGTVEDLLDTWVQVGLLQGAARICLEGRIPNLEVEALEQKIFWDTYNEVREQQVRQFNDVTASLVLPIESQLFKVDYKYGLQLCGFNYKSLEVPESEGVTPVDNSCASSSSENDGEHDYDVEEKEVLTDASSDVNQSTLQVETKDLDPTQELYNSLERSESAHFFSPEPSGNLSDDNASFCSARSSWHSGTSLGSKNIASHERLFEHQSSDPPMMTSKESSVSSSGSSSSSSSSSSLSSSSSSSSGSSSSFSDSSSSSLTSSSSGSDLSSSSSGSSSGHSSSSSSPTPAPPPLLPHHTKRRNSRRKNRHAIQLEDSSLDGYQSSSEESMSDKSSESVDSRNYFERRGLRSENEDTSPLLFVAADLKSYTSSTQSSNQVEVANLAPYLEHFDLETRQFSMHEFPTTSYGGRSNPLNLASSFRQGVLRGNVGESQVQFTSISSLGGGSCMLPVDSGKPFSKRSLYQDYMDETDDHTGERSDDNKSIEDAMHSQILRVDACRIIDVFATPQAIREMEQVMLAYYPVAPNMDQMLNFFEKSYMSTPGASQTSAGPDVGEMVSSSLRVSVKIEGINLRLLHTCIPFFERERKSKSQQPNEEAGDKATSQVPGQQKPGDRQNDRRRRGRPGREKPVPYLLQACSRQISIVMVQKIGESSQFALGGATAVAGLPRKNELTSNIHAAMAVSNIDSERRIKIALHDFEVRLGILHASSIVRNFDTANQRPRASTLFLKNVCNLASFGVHELRANGYTTTPRLDKADATKADSAFNMHLDVLRMQCASDAVHAIYNTAYVWVQAVQSLYEARTGIYFRRQHQWALLAGQVLKLAIRLDSLDARDLHTEHEKVQSLVETCPLEEWRQYNTGEVNLTSVLIMDLFRRIACFVPEYEHLNQEIANCQLDRNAHLNPIPLDILAGVGVYMEDFFENGIAAALPGTSTFFREVLEGCTERAAPQKLASVSRKPEGLELSVSVRGIDMKVYISKLAPQRQSMAGVFQQGHWSAPSSAQVPQDAGTGVARDLDVTSSINNGSLGESTKQHAEHQPSASSPKREWNTIVMIPARYISMDCAFAGTSVTMHKIVFENQRKKMRRPQRQMQIKEEGAVPWLYDIEFNITAKTDRTWLSISPEIVRAVSAVQAVVHQSGAVLSVYYYRRRLAAHLHEQEVSTIRRNEDMAPVNGLNPFNNRIFDAQFEQYTEPIDFGSYQAPRTSRFTQLPSSIDLSIPFAQARQSAHKNVGGNVGIAVGQGGSFADAIGELDLPDQRQESFRGGFTRPYSSSVSNEGPDKKSNDGSRRRGSVMAGFQRRDGADLQITSPNTSSILRTETFGASAGPAVPPQPGTRSRRYDGSRPQSMDLPRNIMSPLRTSLFHTVESDGLPTSSSANGSSRKMQIDAQDSFRSDASPDGDNDAETPVTTEQISIFFSTTIGEVDCEVQSSAMEPNRNESNVSNDGEETRAVAQLRDFTFGWSRYSGLLTKRTERAMRLEDRKSDSEDHSSHTNGTANNNNKGQTQDSSGPPPSGMGDSASSNAADTGRLRGRLRDFVLLDVKECVGKIVGAKRPSAKSSKHRASRLWEIKGVLGGLCVNVMLAVANSRATLGLGDEHLTDVQVLWAMSEASGKVPLHAIDHRRLHDLVDAWAFAYREAAEKWKVYAAANMEPVWPSPSPPATASFAVNNNAHTSQSQKGHNSQAKKKQYRSSTMSPLSRIAAEVRASRRSKRDKKAKRARRRSIQEHIEALANKAAVLDAEASGLVKVRYSVVVRIRNLSTLLQPHSKLLMTYEMESITLTLRKLPNGQLDTQLHLSRSQVAFDKRRRAIGSSETGSLGSSHGAAPEVSFEQSLPCVWIHACLAASKRRLPVSFNHRDEDEASEQHEPLHSAHSRDEEDDYGFMDSTRNVKPRHRKSYSLESVSLNSEPGSRRSGSTLPQVRIPGLGGVLQGKQDDQELVLRLRVVVEPICNSFTPDIVEQFLILQTGLASEINMLLATVSRVSASFAKSSKSRQSKKEQRRATKEEKRSNNNAPDKLESTIHEQASTAQEKLANNDLSVENDGDNFRDLSGKMRRRPPLHVDTRMRRSGSTRSGRRKVHKNGSRLNMISTVTEEPEEHHYDQVSKPLRPMRYVLVFMLGGVSLTAHADEDDREGARRPYAHVNTGKFELLVKSGLARDFATPHEHEVSDALILENKEMVWFATVHFRGLQCSLKQRRGQDRVLFDAKTDLKILYDPRSSIQRFAGHNDDMASVARSAWNQTCTVTVNNTRVEIQPGFIDSGQILTDDYLQALRMYRYMRANEKVGGEVSRRGSEVSGDAMPNKFEQMDRYVQLVWKNVRDPIRSELTHRRTYLQALRRLAVNVGIDNTMILFPFKSPSGGPAAGIIFMEQLRCRSYVDNLITALFDHLSEGESVESLHRRIQKSSHRLYASLNTPEESSQTSEAGSGPTPMMRQRESSLLGTIICQEVKICVTSDHKSVSCLGLSGNFDESLISPPVGVAVRSNRPKLEQKMTMIECVRQVYNASPLRGKLSSITCSLGGNSQSTEVRLVLSSTLSGPDIFVSVGHMPLLAGLVATHWVGVNQASNEATIQRNKSHSDFNPVPHDYNTAASSTVRAAERSGGDGGPEDEGLFPTWFKIKPYRTKIEITARVLQGPGILFGTPLRPQLQQRIPVPSLSLTTFISRDWEETPWPARLAPSDSADEPTTQARSQTAGSRRRASSSTSVPHNVAGMRGRTPSTTHFHLDGVDEVSSPSLEVGAFYEPVTEINSKIEVDIPDMPVTPLLLLTLQHLLKHLDDYRQGKYPPTGFNRPAGEDSKESDFDEDTGDGMSIDMSHIAAHDDLHENISDQESEGNGGISEAPISLRSNVSWNVLVHISPFEASSKFSALSTGDDVDATIVITQGVEVSWSSGMMRMREDDEEADQFVLECVSVNVPTIELVINRASHFSKGMVHSLQAQVNRAHGLMQLPVVVSYFDIERVDVDASVWSMDKLFGVQYGWQRDWLEAEGLLTAAFAASEPSITSSSVYSHAQIAPGDYKLVGQHSSSQLFADSAGGRGLSDLPDDLGGSQEVDSDIDLDDEFMLGSLVAERRKPLATMMVQARVASVEVLVDLGMLHSKMRFRASGLATRYFQPEKRANETEVETTHLYLDMRSVIVQFDGRLEGGMRLDSGLVVHLMRDSQNMPSLEELMNHPSYISANEFKRYQESGPAPINEWQQWMKRKRALNHCVFRMRDQLCAQMSLVFGNDATRQRTMLFSFDSHDFSVYISEVIPENNVCTQLVSVYSSMLDLQASSEMVPILLKLMNTMREQVSDAKKATRPKFLSETASRRLATRRHLSRDSGGTTNDDSRNHASQELSGADNATTRSLKAIGTIYFEIGHFDISVVHGVLNDVRRSAAAAISIDRSAKFSLEIEKRRHTLVRELVVELHGKCDVTRFQKLLVKSDLTTVGMFGSDQTWAQRPTATSGATNSATSTVSTSLRSGKDGGSVNPNETSRRDGDKSVDGSSRASTDGGDGQNGIDSNAGNADTSKGTLSSSPGGSQNTDAASSLPSLDTKRHQKGRKRIRGIFGLPPLKIRMETIQNLISPDRSLVREKVVGAQKYFHLLPTMEYVFHSEFTGPLNTTTDIRDLTYLREIAQSCTRNLTGHTGRFPTVHRDINGTGASMPGSKDQGAGNSGTDGAGGAEGSGSGSSTSEPRRIFKPNTNEREPFVFNPQVSVLGDATTIALNLAMSQLDLNKEKLPEKTHVALTDNLEAVLAVVHDGLRGMDRAFGDRDPPR